VNRRAALVGALLATLGRPATWPLALATFLIRGGIALVLIPIVVLPTTVGIGNVIAPALTSIAFGSVSGQLVFMAVASASAILGWLVLGGWLAAALEVEGIRVVAVDEDVRALGGPGEARASAATARLAARILVARAVAFIPLAVVLAFGTVRVVLVAYRELTSPLDTSTPIVLRVLRETPEVVIAVVLAWMVGEMVGAVAARRIVLAGDGVSSALRTAVVTCVRHPLTNLVRFWLPTIVLFAALLAGAMAAGSAWSSVGDALSGSGNLVATLAVVTAFVVVWLVGLALVALVSAWRTAVWTVAEAAREGTFGGSADRRPGDWRADRSSATL
jgi:hypothetical protein